MNFIKAIKSNPQITETGSIDQPYTGITEKTAGVIEKLFKLVTDNDLEAASITQTKAGVVSVFVDADTCEAYRNHELVEVSEAGYAYIGDAMVGHIKDGKFTLGGTEVGDASHIKIHEEELTEDGDQNLAAFYQYLKSL